MRTVTRKPLPAAWNYSGSEEEEENEDGEAAWNVAEADEEGQLVGEADGAGKGGFLPPWGGGDDAAAGVDDGGDAGVGAASDPAAGLDGAEGGVAEVLPVAGGVAPPGVIGDDREEFGSGAHIFSAVLTIH